MQCPKCGNAMRNTMHFEQDRRYQFNKCEKCCNKTKNKRIHFDDVLKEEIKKSNKNIQTS